MEQLTAFNREYFHRKITNDILVSDDSIPIREAKVRIVNKILETATESNDNLYPTFNITNQLDFFDEDILLVAKHELPNIVVDIEPFNLTFDLAQLIQNAILHDKPHIIELLLKNNIDIQSIVPRVMLQLAIKNQHDQLLKLIEKSVPIHTNNFECVYYLAENGKLELLKIIAEKYHLERLMEVVCKICIAAIKNGHLNIIEYFCPCNAFTGAPDIMFVFLVNSIKYGGHQHIIKYFIDGGIHLRQKNDQILTTAIEFNRYHIVRLLIDIDPSIVDLLTEKQRDICFNSFV